MIEIRPLTLSLLSLLVAACGGGDGSSPQYGGGGASGSGASGGSGTAGASGGSGGQGALGAGGAASAGGQPSQTAGGASGAAGGAGPTGAGGAVGVGGAGNGGAAGVGGSTGSLAQFSFFVTSLKALQQLSGSQSGFGGDLTYGETGAGAGLRGADKICAAIAEMSMPGSSAKQWRAFLSASTGGDSGGPVNAIDRVGNGPWYDRAGRVVALTKADLQNTRPANADAAIVNDLPNEDGVPNHAPDPTAGQVDNHDMLTGSTATGLYAGNTRATCKDWTSKVGSDGAPRCGHSWPRFGGPGGGGPGGNNMASWASALDEAGCAPGVSLIEMGPPNPANPTVGSGGGYGGFYCFALTP